MGIEFTVGLTLCVDVGRIGPGKSTIWIKAHVLLLYLIIMTIILFYISILEKIKFKNI